MIQQTFIRDNDGTIIIAKSEHFWELITHMETTRKKEEKFRTHGLKSDYITRRHKMLKTMYIEVEHLGGRDYKMIYKKGAN